VSENSERSLGVGSGTASFLKEKLADLLTLSRGIIGLTILSLSFRGEDAYTAVVILALIGAATDIFDGKAARRYLGEGREGKLGKYDLEIDTIFIFCIIGYLSFSGIIVPGVVGLGWIGLALITVALYRRKAKVLLFFEIPSIVALIIIAGVYNFEMFTLIILPAIIAGLVIDYKRVLYLIFDYFPAVFSR